MKLCVPGNGGFVVDVTKVATPLEFTVPVPSEVPPSKNVTVAPARALGAPTEGVTVAVRVIACP